MFTIIIHAKSITCILILNDEIKVKMRGWQIILIQLVFHCYKYPDSAQATFTAFKYSLFHTQW